MSFVGVDDEDRDDNDKNEPAAVVFTYIWVSSVYKVAVELKCMASDDVADVE